MKSCRKSLCALGRVPKKVEDLWKPGPVVPPSKVGLQVQQFLDEWHFRVLHSGLATGPGASQVWGS